MATVKKSISYYFSIQTWCVHAYCWKFSRQLNNLKVDMHRFKEIDKTDASGCNFTYKTYRVKTAAWKFAKYINICFSIWDVSPFLTCFTSLGCSDKTNHDKCSHIEIEITQNNATMSLKHIQMWFVTSEFALFGLFSPISMYYFKMCSTLIVDWFQISTASKYTILKSSMRQSEKKTVSRIIFPQFYIFW